MYNNSLAVSITLNSVAVSSINIESLARASMIQIGPLAEHQFYSVAISILSFLQFYSRTYNISIFFSLSNSFNWYPHLLISNLVCAKWVSYHSSHFHPCYVWYSLSWTQHIQSLYKTNRIDPTNTARYPFYPRCTKNRYPMTVPHSLRQIVLGSSPKPINPLPWLQTASTCLRPSDPNLYHILRPPSPSHFSSPPLNCFAAWIPTRIVTAATTKEHEGKDEAMRCWWTRSLPQSWWSSTAIMYRLTMALEKSCDAGFE